jgi:predicted amidohydrolase YtcJ
MLKRKFTRPKSLAILCVLSGFLGFGMRIEAQTPPDVEIFFVNGRIYQPDPSCGKLATCHSHSYAEAIAVKDGKVVAVGDTEAILKGKRKATTVVDLQGRFVLPGFNDAHIHLASGGFEKLNVDLVGSQSLEEMQRRIAARVETAGAAEWIRGRGWDHMKWKSQTLPTRQDLDRVTKGHPAIFARVDGHISVANSVALRAAGIIKDTPDPEGGKIDRDASGEPTGILREGARDAVDRVIPKVTLAERRRALELALTEAAEWGLTSVQDNSSWQDFLVYEQLEQQGKLTLRIDEWLNFDDSLETLESERKHHLASDPLLHTGMLKGFMDGSLGSRTAALLRPYADDPSNSGLPQYDQMRLNEMTQERFRDGFQIGFHAIGDRGVEMALVAFENAMANATRFGVAGTQGEWRLRIEHAQITTPEQIRRFASLGIVSSMQPNHLLTDMAWAVDRVGPERAASSYAWRSFLRAGVPLAFGTDYPVEPLTPFRGLYAAVTRKNEAGTKEYFPEETLTIDEAIRAYTVGAAFAEFEEKTKGQLVPGQWADFVVLDRDITVIPQPQILETKVLRTVVGGKTVYERH